MLAEALQERLRAEPALQSAAAAPFVASSHAALAWYAAERERRTTAREQLLHKLRALPPMPSEAEVRESGECGTCRKDWGKTGARCRHCRIEVEEYDVFLGRLYTYRRQRKVA